MFVIVELLYGTWTFLLSQMFTPWNLGTKGNEKRMIER
jgi:hypothetical protein